MKPIQEEADGDEDTFPILASLASLPQFAQLGYLKRQVLAGGRQEEKQTKLEVPTPEIKVRKAGKQDCHASLEEPERKLNREHPLQQKKGTSPRKLFSVPNLLQTFLEATGLWEKPNPPYIGGRKGRLSELTLHTAEDQVLQCPGVLQSDRLAGR